MAHNERFEELAALQALGLPLGEEGIEFARHLQEGCSICEGLLVDFREASAALAAPVGKVAPRPQIKEQVLRSLGPTSLPIPKPAPARLSRRLLAVAAVLLLAVLTTDDL